VGSHRDQIGAVLLREADNRRRGVQSGNPTSLASKNPTVGPTVGAWGCERAIKYSCSPASDGDARFR